MPNYDTIIFVYKNAPRTIGYMALNILQNNIQNTNQIQDTMQKIL